ncbi:MAG: nuclear transport factor 2 family protein [Limnohabitans sp.]|nr:nuclear transport factor 2 family protein [Limnohabitans sp.]
MTNSNSLIATSEAYFDAVDRIHLNNVLSFFNQDAVFTIATHQQIYKGRDDQIKTMFERLFARYAKVWHGNFRHVASESNRVASQFTVKNTAFDGSVSFKSNCNFFYLRDGKFSEVFVYMTGENSLN